MYSIEPKLTVHLEFRGMEQPVPVSVPWRMLYYLDTHCGRRIAPDGAVVYNLGDGRSAGSTVLDTRYERELVTA
jgi:hypothetical protein